MNYYLNFADGEVSIDTCPLPSASAKKSSVEEIIEAKESGSSGWLTASLNHFIEMEAEKIRDIAENLPTQDYQDEYVMGEPMDPNRVNIELSPDDVLYVAQLQGGRLPEGATTLPEGFSFKWLEVTLQPREKARP